MKYYTAIHHNLVVIFGCMDFLVVFWAVFPHPVLVLMLENFKERK